MAVRYLLTWEERRGTAIVKSRLTSPHMKSKGAALYWLLQQRPYIALDTLSIQAWNRNLNKGK
jgi:hypothetical protein